MSIEPGQTLSHYRLVEKIGEGGMGVVWKAVDTTLNREVAIKILPDSLAHDPGRLARFEREAKLLASLNHTNIATVHGLEDADGARFLTMEFVEGEDLAQRLVRGAIPVEEALHIALQVTEALEAAHATGVIHRDLKPANIRLTPDGKVKVLDFGLAKAFETEPTSGGSSPTMSPTLTSTGTVAGMILGTASYMSPEQARAKPCDKRADIWAFGVMLCEMLTGERLFDGETVSDVLAAVLRSDPDWSTLPEGTPRSVRRLLRRCLQRDPRNRLHDIADARIELDDAASAEPGEEPVAAMAAAPAWKRALPWTVAAVGLVLAAWSFVRSPSGAADTAIPAARFDVDVGTPDWTTGALPFALSPDGSTLVYASSAGTTTQLYRRNIDEFDGTPIPDTEDAHTPFFSPDGKWIGFVANGQLMKLSLIGGKPQALCPVPHSPGGASWSADGTIVFSTSFARAGLFRISADGGTVEELTSPDLEAGENYHRWPQFLPGGRDVLFTIRRAGLDVAAVVTLDGGEWRELPGIHGRAQYLDGHLLYGEAQTLLAIPFDLDRLQPTGDPFAVIDDIPHSVGAGANVNVSRTKVLAFLPARTAERSLVWVDRDGKVTPLDYEPAEYEFPRLSPNGDLLSVYTGAQTLLVFNLERGGRTSIEVANFANWTPDGAWLIYTSRISGVPNLYRARPDGSGQPEPVVTGDNALWASSVSSDGRYVAYYEQHPETSRDIWVFDLRDDGTPEPLVVTAANERSAAFSPDGRWFAYTSNRSGRDEVYVRSFEPRGERDHLVSTARGREPMWSRDGQELFYRVGNALMAVLVELQPEFSAGKPRPLFEGNWSINAGGLNAMYDVAPDGQRFLMIRESDATARINVVLDWQR